MLDFYFVTLCYWRCRCDEQQSTKSNNITTVTFVAKKLQYVWMLLNNVVECCFTKSIVVWVQNLTMRLSLWNHKPRNTLFTSLDAVPSK